MTDTARVVALMALIDPDKIDNPQDVVLALDEALRAARLDERRAVAAYLRAGGRSVRDPDAGRAAVLERIAERIESGAYAGDFS